MEAGEAHALGVRVTPTGVEWTVVRGSRETPEWVDGGRAQAPAHDSSEAEALTWYRQRFYDLVGQFSIGALAVRYAELATPSRRVDSDRRRARIEGVILEAAAARRCDTLTGAWKSISSRLGTPKAKDYVTSASVRGLDLSGMKKEAQEAAIVAVSALPSESEASS